MKKDVKFKQNSKKKYIQKISQKLEFFKKWNAKIGMKLGMKCNPQIGIFSFFGFSFWIVIISHQLITTIQYALYGHNKNCAPTARNNFLHHRNFYEIYNI